MPPPSPHTARTAGANRRAAVHGSRAEAGARRPGLPAPTTAARTTPPLYPSAYRVRGVGSGRKGGEKKGLGQI